MSNNDSQVLRQIVLGAGASSGYPLGSDLLGIIKGISNFFNSNILTELIAKLKSINLENNRESMDIKSKVKYIIKE